MCRWGCTTNHTTYMCKWCGTRYCKECLHGDFIGLMPEPTKCRKCNHTKCQGQRVEYVPSSQPEGDLKGSTRSGGKSAKGRKSATKKKSGKKSGKKSPVKKKKRK